MNIIADELKLKQDIVANLLCVVIGDQNVWNDIEKNEIHIS